MPATEDTTDRCAGDRLLAELAATLDDCAGELAAGRLNALVVAASSGTVEELRRRGPDTSRLPAEGLVAGPSAEVPSAWAAAARVVGDLSIRSGAELTEAEAMLVDAIFDPVAPAWLIVDAVVALIVEQAAIDARPDEVVAIDRSLDGLRHLVNCLRRRLSACS